jgi:hypothetical protein
MASWLVAALKAVGRALRTRRLRAADWRLLACVRAIDALAFTGISIWPVASVRALLARLRPLATRLGGGAPDARVIWALASIARYCRRSTCLSRALTAELLLSSKPGPLTIVVGVAAPAQGHMESHAWVERDGQVLVGTEADTGRFVPLVSWNGGGA